MVAAGDRVGIVETSTIFLRAHRKRRRVEAVAVLLDRDGELTELGTRLAEARAGSGRVIVVEGPAGIGKSTLLAAAVQMTRTDGVTVLLARCSPLEQHAAWGMARQLFEPLRTTAEWDELTVGAAGLAERALAPDAGEPAPGGDAMHAATRGLVWLASNLGERGPAVFVIDDIHWADAPSLRWLALLARSLDELRIGVVCAVRSGEPAAAPELLAELLAGAPEAPVRPRALGPTATETVVRERLPAAGAPFAHACHAVTGGNPFLLGALLGHLVAERVEPTEEVGSRLITFGPEQVGRTVELQLSRLPEGATALARALAVLGRGAPLRLARDLAELEPAEASLLADRLVATGLLAEDGGEYALVHPLVAGALYGGLGAAERALWHERAARLLEREGSDPEAVALHLLHTEPSGAAATVAVLLAAAQRAGLRGAPETASVFLRRALREPPPERALEANVRGELGLALAAHVQPDAPALLAEAVELAGTPGRRAEIALSAGRALGLAGYFDDALGLCRRGLEQPDGIPAELLARLEAELVADGFLNAATVHEAREGLRRLGSSTPPLELWRIMAAWEAVCEGRPASEVRALLALALEAGALESDPESLLGTFAKYVLIANGDLDAAREHCSAFIDFARPRGWLIALAHGSFLRAMALIQAGRIRDAEADARFSFDFKLANSRPDALLWGLFPLVDALTELGELDDADAALAAAGRLGDPPRGALPSPLLLESRARLRLAQHRPADAHTDLIAAAERWDDLGVRHPGLAAWRVDDAAALVALGDIPAARRLAEEHLELAERAGLPGPWGAGLRALAHTAEREEAIAALEHAVDLVAESPAQLEHARALVDLGAALRRANQRTAARDPLRRGLDLADRGGMRALARRARDELRATGARPRRSALSGVDSLTPAEHRVATLAAQGHGNREIAQQLYVTRRTVETHLTHVFQKLGLTTRGELAAHFPGGDLSPPPTDLEPERPSRGSPRPRAISRR
jgi:DNA-binding CsgD family transcriptional regulator